MEDININGNKINCYDEYIELNSVHILLPEKLKNTPISISVIDDIIYVNNKYYIKDNKIYKMNFLDYILYKINLM